MIQASIVPARNPFRTRSIFAAPIFWAEKLDSAFPNVEKDVIVNVFNLIAAEYPAITADPKEFTRLWIKIFPTETKLCCKMLGTAIFAIRRSMDFEYSITFPCPVGSFATRLNSVITARMPAIPYARNVAQPTPDTPK